MARVETREVLMNAALPLILAALVTQLGPTSFPSSRPAPSGYGRDAAPLAPATKPVEPERVRREVEGVAREVEVLAPSTVIWNRFAAANDRPLDVLRGPPKVRRLLDQDEPAAAIKPLLDHPDARVRILAAAMLYDKNDWRLLDALLPMLDDADPAFRSADYRSAIDPAIEPTPPQPVSSFVRPLLLFHLDHANPVLPGVARGKGQYEPEAVREAWRMLGQARGDRNDTAGSFVVRYLRAAGGTSPLQSDRFGDVERVLWSTGALPMPERFFTLLRLHDENKGWFEASDVSYSSDYLLALARSLPRETRLAVLRGERVSDDPDLPNGFGDTFVMSHAGDLLLAEDAELLLDLEQKQRRQSASQRYPNGSASQEPVIAAAVLCPEKAPIILKNAMRRFDGEYDGDRRAKLAAALFRAGGLDEADYLRTWLFDFTPARGQIGGGREGFLWACRQNDPAGFRRFAAGVVRDERLSQLGPQSSFILIDTAQGILGRRLVSEAEERSHYGVGEAQRDGPFEPLARWHAALRRSVNEWDLSADSPATMPDH